MEIPRLSKNTLLVALTGFAVAGFCFGLALLINLLFYTDLEVALQLALQLSDPPSRRFALFQALEAGIWSRRVTIGVLIFYYDLWPLWITTTFMIIRLADDVTSSNFWNAAFRGTPAWMKWFVVLYATTRKLWAPKQLESEKQQESYTVFSPVPGEMVEYERTTGSPIKSPLTYIRVGRVSKGNLPPKLLTASYLNLSTHTALIIRSNT